mgnify:CR=1 FL=1
MYIDRIQLDRIKCFAKAEATFCHPDRSVPHPLDNIHLVVGINGVGKSTLLQSIVLGLLGMELRDSGWIPTGWRQHGMSSEDRARVAVDPVFHNVDGALFTPGVGQARLRADLLPRGDRRELVDIPGGIAPRGYAKELYNERASSLFLAAYGTGRRTESGSSFDVSQRHTRYTERFQRVASLYLSDFTLPPLSSWLPRSKRRDEVLALLGELLPEVEVTPELEQGDVMVDVHGVRQPIGHLSDGYRSFIGWTGDLLYRLEQACPPDVPLKKLPGVVLVDEVDLHLHPEWQHRVVSTLSAALPRLQFICTTHSPLVVGSVYQHNLSVLVRKDKWVDISPANVSPFGLSADQVLKSATFGLSTVRAPAFDVRLRKVAEDAASGDSDAVLRYHRMLAYGAAGEAQ